VVCISHRDPQGAYRMHDSNSHFAAQTLEHYLDIILEQLECTRRINELLASLGISSEPIKAEYDENFAKRCLVCKRLNLDSPNRSSSSPTFCGNTGFRSSSVKHLWQARRNGTFGASLSLLDRERPVCGRYICANGANGDGCNEAFRYR